MSPRTQRWSALLASTLVAASVGAWILARRAPRELATTVAFRAPAALGAVPFPRVAVDDFFRPEPAPPDAPERWRFHLTREMVESAWGAFDPRLVYDPWTYVWDGGLRDEVYPLAEHPRGRWRLATNRAGLRETGEPQAERRDVRVLATGDSHAFGVCDTDETFASVLERRLAGRLAPRSVEVLNAAQPGFDAFNYLGVLHRFRELEPQVFVVLFFGGNDLLSPLDSFFRFTGETPPPQPAHDKRRRAEVVGRAPNAYGQCYESAPYLLAHPELGPLAARINARLCADMQAACAARGTRLVVAYLPPPCDLEFPEPHPQVELGRTLSGLPEGAGSGLAAVEQRFLEELAALAIEVVDLRAPFAAAGRPPYWRADLHLDVEGHRLVAEALLERLEGAWR